MPPDFSKLLNIGEKVSKFQAVLEKTANELESDHPQKELLQRLAAMVRAQRSAVGDALARFDQVAKEQLAKSKAELEAFQKEFAATQEKLQGIIDSAQSGVAPSPKEGPAATTPPTVEIDPNFGKALGKELLNKYGPLKGRPGVALEDREIWQDWD